jgi:hypothetical protein
MQFINPESSINDECAKWKGRHEERRKRREPHKSLER